jgi:hypothetical protein
MVAYSDNVTIKNVYLFKNFYGTYFYRSNKDIIVEDSTADGNSRGSYCYECSEIVYRNILYDSNYDAVWMQRSYNIMVDNSSIVATNRWNLNIEYGSTLTFLNTSFNPNKIRTAHANTEFTVMWYLHVRVVDDLGNPTAAHVTVLDGKRNIVTAHDIQGHLYWVKCIGYRQIPGKIFYEFNNYTVEAQNATSNRIREVNMTYSRNVKFLFNSKPSGNLPAVLEFEEDTWLELDLTDYFNDRNKMIFATYVYHYLDLALDNPNSLLNITAAPNWCGSEFVTLRVIDEHGLFIESTARINIIPVNDPPYFKKTVPDIHIGEGIRSYKFDLADYIADPDSKYCVELFSWYIEGEDENKLKVLGENSTDTMMELVVVDPDFNGNHKLELVIEDTKGAKAKQDLWVNITPRNDAPELTGFSVSPEIGDTETEFTFFVTYSDIEGDRHKDVQLVLDGITYPMVEENRTDTNTKDGKIFTYRTKISEIGQHYYSINAADIYSAVAFSHVQKGPYVQPTIPTTGIIKGRVIDKAFGIGLSGADVSLLYSFLDSEVPNGTTTSNQHGEFTFEDLEPNFYTVFVDFDGYVSLSRDEILTRPGETTEDIVFELEATVAVSDTPEADTKISDVKISIIFVKSTIFEGDDIILNGTAEDPDGDSLIYYWDFGDDTTNPVGTDTKHNYTKAGWYNVTLTVLDEDGNIASATESVIVTALPVEEEDKVVEEPKKDIYGNNGWLIGAVLCIAVLVLILPWVMYYRGRRKRAKTATKKLRALKKRDALQAAARAQAAKMMPIPTEVKSAEQVQGAVVEPDQQLPTVTGEIVPEPVDGPQPALPPTPIPETELESVVEAEIAKEAEEDEEAQVFDGEIAEEE